MLLLLFLLTTWNYFLRNDSSQYEAVQVQGRTSTLTRLITGIYLCDKGKVTWNGSDLADTDPGTVWRLTGLVPQESAKWPLRVRENITLGQPRTHDDGPVWEAVDAVGLREAVEDLPNGLDSLQARDIWGGVEFSGGQWQREARARALYRKPELLILDEPTSQSAVRDVTADLPSLDGVTLGHHGRSSVRDSLGWWDG